MGWPVQVDDLDGLEERFFDLSIDLLCCLDFRGYFKRLSPSWETALGYTRDELMAKPFIEFVHPEDRERTLAQNGRVRSGGQARLFENRYVCKDGSPRWLRWNARPDAGRGVIFAVARDFTEQKVAEEEREKLVENLRSALAEVRTLRAFLPICAYCKRIRDDENYWHSVETYLAEHANATFTHGICPPCFRKLLESQGLEPEKP